MKSLKSGILTPLAALVLLCAAGVSGYSLIEGRFFTIVLILGGIGVMTYIFTSITELLLEGGLKEAIRRFKMQIRLEDMNDHYIVCGATRSGLSVCEELSKTARPFALAVLKEEEVKKFMARGWCAVAGDASSCSVLETAGIRKARGIFCALSNDKDNALSPSRPRASRRPPKW